MVVAFSIAQGKKDASTNYTWRLAATVLDVLAEFGAENTALVTRSPELQGVLSAVLKRFGESDLQKIETAKGVLQAALSATLNGAIEGGAKLSLKNRWLDGLLDAVISARDSIPEGIEREEYLMGLFRGKGYPTLVASVLNVTAAEINDDQSTDFRDVTADFLKSVAGIVATKTNFKGFFRDHWGDMVRAALASTSTYGSALLGEKKLLGKLLEQIAGELSKRDDLEFLSADSIYGIVNTAASVLSTNPELAGALLGADKAWIGKLVGSVAGTIAKEGISKVFSKEGVEVLVKDTLATLAKHPELLFKDGKLEGSELVTTLIGGILGELSKTEGFAARTLATATVSGALKSLAENPALVGTKYPEMVASFAGHLAKLVQEKKLTGVQGTDLLDAGLASFAENPALFLDLQNKVGEEVVAAIVDAAAGKEALLAGGVMLSRIARQCLAALARSGKDKISAEGTTTKLLEQLRLLLDTGLDQAEKELGESLSLPSLPDAMGYLVEAWAKGPFAEIDPTAEQFQKLFAEAAVRSTPALT